MAPTEHGEVFVMHDGGEADLDLGNYERYLNVTLSRDHNITTGKVYKHVIEKERRGDYLGRTVQIVPHLTDAIQDWIERVARIPVDDSNEEPNVCVIELGGTLGDIESAPFVEAMRQLRRRAGKDNFLQIHVSLVPVVHGELKTKPTQQAIRDARSAGLSPDLIACRCEKVLDKATTDKIAMFCQVEPEQVIGVHDVASTYHVPLLLEEQGFLAQLRSILKIDAMDIPQSLITKGQATLKRWRTLTTSQEHVHKTVNIALVGKYVSLHDSYLSVIKALEHSAMACRRKLDIIWVDSSKLEKATSETHPEAFHKAWHEVCTADGILVPGGFGTRGTEGMIAAANWARTKPKPFLGICLGMQIAVIEYARNVCNIPGAGSIELDERTADPVIMYMPEIDQVNLGGTMRLGTRPTNFQDDTEWSKLRSLYGSGCSSVDERHRHRYEVNPDYIDRLQSAGLRFIGKDDKGERMEIIELKDHPWFVGVQFHPEYLSRVLAPSKPFLGFIATAGGVFDEVMQKLDTKEMELANGVSEIII
ncbi:CTP synthase ura7 [Arachnomyces sp. PD_36]|nr:CTP synthase ura7 [Arachnomyces sp. PD_36]